MSPPNPAGRRCHVPGCNAWALRDSDPPNWVSHAGRGDRRRTVDRIDRIFRIDRRGYD
jgi:hypothetical protein